MPEFCKVIATIRTMRQAINFFGQALKRTCPCMKITMGDCVADKEDDR